MSTSKKHGQGETLPAQGETQQPVPRMPHEHDESAGSTQRRSEPSQARIGKAAGRDAERGLVDTSKGAELDATYDKLRDDLPPAEREKNFTP